MAILAVMGVVESHMMETARKLFIAIIALEFVSLLITFISKFFARNGFGRYQVTTLVLHFIGGGVTYKQTEQAGWG